MVGPGVPTGEAHDVIAKVARVHLTHNIFGDGLTTYDLVEALYPIRLAIKTDEGAFTRERIRKALTKRALGSYQLADCMTEGPPQRVPGHGAYVRMPIWHAPGQVLA